MTCIECGINKPSYKFPFGKTRCLACTCRMPELLARRAARLHAQQPGDPDPDEILAQAAAMRARWSAKKTAARRRGG